MHWLFFCFSFMYQAKKKFTSVLVQMFWRIPLRATMPVFLLMDKQVKRECISCDLQGSFSCLPFLLLILLLLRQFFVITLDFITRSELKNWPGSLIPTKCQECMTAIEGRHAGRRRGAWGKEEGDMQEGGGGHVGKRSKNAPLPFMLQKQWYM